MRALIVGLGSIGRRHLMNLRALDPQADITVLRHARTDEPVAPANRYVFALEDALRAKPDIALICGPAATHVPVARRLAESGVHLFIEKPLSHTLEGTQELIELCARNRLTLTVGYNLRFLQSLEALRESLQSGSIGRLLTVRAEAGYYLPAWRQGIDYRSTASASASLGGGATLEISHEFDLVRWICGEVSDVAAMTARIGDLDIDVEDTAEIIVRFRSGAFGSIHLDMLQRTPTRLCTLVGTQGRLSWSMPAEDVAATYPAELADFLQCASTGAAPRISGLDGLRALEIAVAAKASAQEGRRIALSDVGIAHV